MKNIWTIAQREYRVYFSAPIGYVVAAGILFVVGFIFGLAIYGASQSPGYVPGMDIVTNTIPFMFVFTVPAITMRLIADESRSGTIEILLTTPVRDWEVVTGKWLGAFLYFLTVLLFSVAYPLMLNNMVDPGIDQGLVITGYLAMAMIASAMIAIGIFISSLFTNLIAAYVVSMGTLLMIWFLMGAPARFASGRIATALRYIDFNGHFQSMASGVISLSDPVYFVSLTALFLLVSAVALESRRWR
ncbi:MAG: ABC transporter permease [Anaerolineae bacterium]|nr:ABC transporter permease [Anaerolineae bacterium]